jgi:septum formation protein
VSSVVLASTSSYRQRLLANAGIEARVVAPDFDERCLDRHFEEWGVDRYVVEVATGKARSVLHALDPGTVVIAADQVAVENGRLLTKPGTVDQAVAQLVSLSGTTHDLVNGVVVARAGDGRMAWAVDRHLVTMRAFDQTDARSYVEAFRPLDCVGAYRIEDDADLIASVVGSGDDGVIGLPMAVVRSLMAQLA